MRGLLAKVAVRTCEEHGGCCAGGNCHMFGCPGETPRGHVKAHVSNLLTETDPRFLPVVIKPKGHETSAQELSMIKAANLAKLRKQQALAKKRRESMALMREKLLALLKHAKQHAAETAKTLQRQMDKVQRSSGKQVTYTRWSYLSDAAKIHKEIKVASMEEKGMADAKAGILANMKQLHLEA